MSDKPLPPPRRPPRQPREIEAAPSPPSPRPEDEATDWGEAGDAAASRESDTFGDAGLSGDQGRLESQRVWPPMSRPGRGSDAAPQGPALDDAAGAPREDAAGAVRPVPAENPTPERATADRPGNVDGQALARDVIEPQGFATFRPAPGDSGRFGQAPPSQASRPDPAAWDAQTIKIGLWGSPASGKTTYLAALQHALDHPDGSIGRWTIWPRDDV